jgi:hypothetical protein
VRSKAAGATFSITLPRIRVISGIGPGELFEMVPGKLLYWVMTSLAGISVVLVIVNGVIFLTDQSAQAEVNQRQQFINQSAQLGRVQEGLIRALALSAANNKDDQLRDLLAQFNISYTVNPPPAAAGAKN